MWVREMKKIAALVLLAVIAAMPLQAAPPVVGIAPGIPVAIIPTPYTTQGVMTVNTTSTTLVAGSVTLTSGSAAFPAGALPNGIMEVQNQGSVNVTACWTGSPCVVGQTLEPGRSVTVALPNFAASPPSFIASGATAQIGFKM